MPVQITIRDVPETVRDRLKARASSRGQSMQGFLRSELERISNLPNTEELIRRIEERVEASGTNVSVEAILHARDKDRK